MSCSSIYFYEDYKKGDILLVGFFRIYEKIVNDECDMILNVQVFVSVEVMVYVVEQVDKDVYLFLNIILGYCIFDICGIFF